MKIDYIGHSCVLLNGSKKVLVDPFITGNPKAKITADEVEADYILVTHGHADHLGDAVEIAKRTGAEVIAMVELGNWIGAHGVTAHPINIGGSLDFGDFKVKMVSATHSSCLPTGEYCGLAAGFIFWLDDICFYHAGDTGLFSDMAYVIAGFEIDLSFLPIGGYYTMDAKDAVKAVKWLECKDVMPIHYNTFPAITTDLDKFVHDVTIHTVATARPVQPGESLEYEKRGRRPIKKYEKI